MNGDEVLEYDRPNRELHYLYGDPALGFSVVQGMIVRAAHDYMTRIEAGTGGVCVHVKESWSDDVQVVEYGFVFENHEIVYFAPWEVDLFLEPVEGGVSDPAARNYRMRTRSMLRSDTERGLFNAAFARAAGRPLGKPTLRLVR